MIASLSPQALLHWYLEAGVDEAVADVAIDRFRVVVAPPAPVAMPAFVPITAPPPPTTPLPTTPPPAGDGAVKSAYALAASAETLDELRRHLLEFEGCALRKTATNLVFFDGNPEARIVFVGEAPGAEEDRQGLPFVGPAGKLLDRMLASIGLDRTRVLISNTVFWRPPGNRSPTLQEMAVCQPFVERLVEIVDPEFVVALGGAAAKTLFAHGEGIGRLHGRWLTFTTPRLSRPVQATALYHPAYLLRSPAQKRETWRDLLALKKKLDAL